MTYVFTFSSEERVVIAHKLMQAKNIYLQFYFPLQNQMHICMEISKSNSTDSLDADFVYMRPCAAVISCIRERVVIGI